MGTLRKRYVASRSHVRTGLQLLAPFSVRRSPSAVSVLRSMSDSAGFRALGLVHICIHPYPLLWISNHGWPRHLRLDLSFRLERILRELIGVGPSQFDLDSPFFARPGSSPGRGRALPPETSSDDGHVPDPRPQCGRAYSTATIIHHTSSARAVIWPKERQKLEGSAPRYPSSASSTRGQRRAGEPDTKS